MSFEPYLKALYSSYKLYLQYSDGSKTIKATATGFMIQLGDSIWMVTNRHVVEADYKSQTSEKKNFKLSNMSIYGIAGPKEYFIFVGKDVPTVAFHPKYENDVVLIKVNGEFIEGKRFGFAFHPQDLANEESYKQIHPLYRIAIPGYSNQENKRDLSPVFRTGFIATDVSVPYSWNVDDQGDCVAYEGFSSNGASGGPVFSQENLNTIIGVNAGHINESYSHSGISYFYKSTVILEIIENYNLLPPQQQQ